MLDRAGEALRDVIGACLDASNRISTEPDVEGYSGGRPGRGSLAAGVASRRQSIGRRCTDAHGPGASAFTMSLLIATLAFDGRTLLDSAKVGILGGSIVSGVVGAIVLRRGTRAASRGLLTAGSLAKHTESLVGGGVRPEPPS